MWLLVNLGYGFFVGTDPVKLGERTLLAMKVTSVVDVKQLRPNVCHCKVKIYGIAPFYLSCIYVPPSSAYRLAFWNWISTTSQSFDGPWLIIGGCNETFCFEDKLSSTSSSSIVCPSFCSVLTWQHCLILPKKVSLLLGPITRKKIDWLWRNWIEQFLVILGYILFHFHTSKCLALLRMIIVH